MPPVTSGEVPFLRWGLEMPKEESWSRHSLRSLHSRVLQKTNCSLAVCLAPGAEPGRRLRSGVMQGSREMEAAHVSTEG